MTLEHVALWTDDLEKQKMYYCRFFDGKSNSLYHNPQTGFRSYFLTFEGGARLEIMQKTDIPPNLNDRKTKQHLGLIHLAFGAASKDEVDGKAKELLDEGFEILRGPRTTGDGYYEFETLDPDGNRIEVTFKG
ncbi:VOC family protein [Pararhodonellum marinum]|uniref:VOC family protein n=1 Tax=Pararhodonellum marinum TaxID=2755358 RepID=UPI0018908988|nr:VOC family protein [Pararhodonellum marinum]